MAALQEWAEWITKKKAPVYRGLFFNVKNVKNVMNVLGYLGWRNAFRGKV